MVAKKVLLIAGTTQDIVNGSLNPRIGGSAYYALTALTHIDVHATVVTNTSYIRRVCGRYGHHRILTPSPEFNIVYEISLRDGADRELRLRSELRTMSAKIEELINDGLGSFDAVLISPVAREITARDVARVAEEFENVVVDIQGLVRAFDSDGRMWIDHNLSRDVIRRLRDYDIVIRGEISEFPPECWGPSLIRCVEGHRAKAIQTMGEGPIYIAYPDGRVFMTNALSHAHGDDIGAGDVFSSILTTYLPKGTLREAVAVATAASFLKIVRSRIPWFSLHEVLVISEKVLGRMRRLH